VLAFPQFLRYAGEIDMDKHAWMEYDFQVDLMTGLDFRGKTVGPVCFETVGIVNQYKWIILKS